MTDRSEVRRDAEEWKERLLVDSSGWAVVVTEKCDTILALLAELKQADRNAKIDAERLAKISRLKAQAERERDDANTRLQSLRWLLGLDVHEGEEEQSATASHANLDALLRDPAWSVPCSAEQREAALVEALRDFFTEHDGNSVAHNRTPSEATEAKMRAALAAQEQAGT